MTPAVLMILEVIWSSKWSQGVIKQVLGTVLAFGKQKDVTEEKLAALAEKLKAMPADYDPTEAELRAALEGYHAASDALEKL